MNKAVLLGIVAALDKEFGLSVYVNSVEQGAEYPCFLVAKLNGGMKRRLGNRYKMSNYYHITYLTESDKPTMEQIDVEEQLYRCLEFIEVDGSLAKETEIECTTIDGVLHCFVSYNFFVKKQVVKEDAMEHITLKTKLGE